jgi:hypothetical protein
MSTLNDIVVGVPVQPARTIALAAAMPSSQRSCWFTARHSPAAWARPISSRAVARSGANGLWHSTCLPAAITWQTSSGCAHGTTAMSTTSTPPSAQQFVQRGVDPVDPVLPRQLLGALGVHVVHPANVQTEAPVRRQVSDVHDGAGADHGDPAAMLRRYGDRDLLRDRREQVEHQTVTPGMSMITVSPQWWRAGEAVAAPVPR